MAASLGHSESTIDQARAGYAAGARSTTHLFNAMTGVDHRVPGLAVAALLDDAVYVELIADGNHVHPALWPLVVRAKGADRLVLISDALPIAGSAARRGRIGGLECEVRDGRAVVAGTDTLAGSVIALDTAVRNVAEGHGAAGRGRGCRRAIRPRSSRRTIAGGSSPGGGPMSWSWMTTCGCAA